MKNLNLTAILIVFLLPLGSFAQQTTVGLQVHNNDTFEGYTLFTPSENNNVYLINNCGELIHEWVFDEKPGLTCYLLENGNLLRAGKTAVEIRDWDNNVIWSFLTDKIGENQHHDIEPLPNGNVMMLVGDRHSASEMIEMGRDSLNVDNVFKLDKLIEIEPFGTDSALVVWEWKFTDHLIQDFDSTKANYGIIEDHPELLDINFDNGQASDYTHINGIDYNVELDQIMVTSRNLGEILIIDHSTTTEEAASHTGGSAGKGGDFLWRWGNPQVYKQGDTTDQKLFLIHDASWVEPGYLDEGKISVFNNNGDGSGTFSSIHLINPEIANGQYTMSEGLFLPLEFDWSWNGTIFDDVVYESKKSSVQSLPNGNVLICEDSKGRISELSKSGEQLWTYVNPSGAEIYNQFETPFNNFIFRAEKYPANYVGFGGQDLTPLGLIEDQNSISNSCAQGVEIFEISNVQRSIVNPVLNGEVHFNWKLSNANILISDLMGRVVYLNKSYSGKILPTELHSGTYLMTIQSNQKIYRYKFICE